MKRVIVSTILSIGVVFLSNPRRSGNGLLVRIFALIAVLVGTAHSQPATPTGPNVVLTEVAFFLLPQGEKVTLMPGRYLVEAVGAKELRLTPIRGGESTVIKADVLRHEQYELFSPFALTRPGAGGGIHISLLLPGGLELDAVGETRQPPPQSKSEQSPAGRPPVQRDETEKKLASPQLAYVPPRDQSSGARVISGAISAQEKIPRIVPLAPDHVGLTTREQPVLYWYLSQDLSDPVDVTFGASGESRPIFEARLVPPLHAGLQTLSLAEFGVRLSSRVPYEWRVTCRIAIGEREVVGGGVVMRIPPPDQLSTELVRASRSDFPNLYAQSGIWYDALAVVSDLIVASPTDSTLRLQRASLLEQVGLNDLARFDREAKLVSR